MVRGVCFHDAGDARDRAPPLAIPLCIIRYSGTPPGRCMVAGSDHAVGG